MRSFSFVFVFISVATGSGIEGCPEENVFEDKCYTIIMDSGILSFNDAITKCQKISGRLAQIKSESLLDFIKKIIPWTLLPEANDETGIPLSLWVSADSRLNNSMIPKMKGKRFFKRCKTIRLNEMELTGTACTRLHYPLCQIPVKHCSLTNIKIDHSNFEVCEKENQNEVTWKTNIEVSCSSGYNLHGPERITCKSDGNWTEMPQCLQKCLPPKIHKKNMKVYTYKKSYDVGEEILIVCIGGYVSGEKYLNSHVFATCGHNGEWSKIIEPVQCIPHGEVNCPSHVCQSIQTRVKENEEVDLTCSWNRTENDVNEEDSPSFHWLKNHEKLKNDDRVNLEGNGRLRIKEFRAEDAGIYTCIRGSSYNNVEMVVIYILKKWVHCEFDDNDSAMTSVLVHEGKTVYLTIRGEDKATAMNVVWFKNSERIWGDKKKIILPSGDLLVHDVGPEDEGYYTFEVEKEVDVCVDRTTKLEVIPKAETICGLASPGNNHPWLVTLWWQSESVPFCYGTLVAKNWVVTSCYCLFRFQRNNNLNMSISLGLNTDQGTIGVEKLILHPFYSRRLNINDIGLVKLTTDVVFDDRVRPICTSDFDFSKLIRDSCKLTFGFQGNMSGFGSLNVDKINASIKSEAMASVDPTKCQHHLIFSFPQSMFCAELDKKHAPTPRAADNGSPFEVTWHKRVHLAGVYSWGERYSEVGPYDYFTKMSSQYEWIQNGAFFYLFVRSHI